MTTLQVQLADRTFAFLAEQAAAQGFGSAADYLAALASEAEAHRDVVEQELAKGVESGPAREWTRADWDGLKRRVWERDTVDRKLL